MRFARPLSPTRVGRLHVEVHDALDVSVAQRRGQVGREKGSSAVVSRCPADPELCISEPAGT
jgi:hypothetical protein